ncbi:hypothetical protein EYF80_011445 [Liparis tanakae]|uniref:Uncharacterized protein n=1 Tax=Liparis tanakae TaxID=230148 RepID=A0A4Z2IK77_9TELE|nr:hypothetical protein EYF80_011445 [Liparis tanakae]
MPDLKPAEVIRFLLIVRVISVAVVIIWVRKPIGWEFCVELEPTGNMLRSRESAAIRLGVGLLPGVTEENRLQTQALAKQDGNPRRGRAAVVVARPLLTSAAWDSTSHLPADPSRLLWSRLWARGEAL